MCAGKIMCDFSERWWPVRIFYIEINGNLIFDLQIFTSHVTTYDRKSTDGCISS